MNPPKPMGPMTTRKERSSVPSAMSRFGRTSFEGGNLFYAEHTGLNELVQRIKAIGTESPKRKRKRRPKLTDLDLDKRNEGFAIDQNRVIESPKKPVREVRRVITEKKVTPGADHYNPKYEAILPSTHIIHLSNNPEKQRQVTPRDATQGEMIRFFTSAMREVNLAPSNSRPAIETVESPTKEAKGVGIVSGSAQRYSYLRPNTNPSPGAYNPQVQESKHSHPRFDQQSERPSIVQTTYGTYRDIRKALDYTHHRVQQAVSFDQQVPREKLQLRDRDIWSDIDAEQKAFLEIINPTRKEKKAKRKEEQPFSKQTSNFGKSPFRHLFTEASPDAPMLNMDIEERKAKRPVTAFDIRQPAFKGDRTIYAKTSAPDIVYEDAPDQWKKTQQTEGSPIPLALQQERKPPYEYMPQQCGKGKYLRPGSTLSPRTTVNYSVMSRRKTMLNTRPPDS